MTVKELLHNYQTFAYKVRFESAKQQLAVYQNPDSSEELKKIASLRIVEDFVSSTEDLSMWLNALEHRDNLGEYPDIWSFTTKTYANTLRDFLSEVDELENIEGFLTKFRLPAVEQLSKELGIEQDKLTKALEGITQAAQAVAHNRLTGNGTLIEFQNRVKHGMMVIDQEGHLEIRSYHKDATNGKIAVAYQHLALDEGKLSDVVDTMRAIKVGLRGVVALLIFID